MSRLFDNTIVFAFDTVAVVVASLLATPFLISGLGIEVYGVYIFLNIFTVYGALLLFDFGLEGSVINYVARANSKSNKRKVREVYFGALFFYGIIALVVSLVFHLFSTKIGASFQDTLKQEDLVDIINGISLMPFVIFIQFITLSFSSVLEGLRKYYITKGVGVVLTLIQYSLITYVALATHSLYEVYKSILFVSIIRFLLLFVFLIIKDDNFSDNKFSFSFTTTKDLVQYSSVLFISRLVGFVFNHMDKFLIWKFLSPAAMAIYDIVVRPASLLRIVITVVNSAVIPEVSHHDANNSKDEVKKILYNFIRFTYALIIPLMFLLVLNMRFLIDLWVGEEFSKYYMLAFILVMIYVVNPIPAIASTIFVGMELVNKTILVSVIGALINFTLSFSLVDRYGIAGLLVSTLLAEIFMFLPFCFFCKKYIGASYVKLFNIPLKLFLLYSPLFLLVFIIFDSASPEVMFILSIVSLLVSYFFSYFVVLESKERDLIKSKLSVRFC